MLFNEICLFLDQVSKTKSSLLKKKYLSNLILKNKNSIRYIYLCLLGQWDFVDLQKDHFVSEKLLFYFMDLPEGDLISGTVAFWTQTHILESTKKNSIKDIFLFLVELGSKTGKNSREEKKKLFCKFIMSLGSELELIYFIKLFFQKAPIGFSKLLINSTLENLVPHSINYYSFSSRYPLFLENYFLLDQLPVFLPGTPIQLALADRGEIPIGDQFYFEPKLDGMRVQIHFDGQQHFIFSRAQNLCNYFDDWLKTYKTLLSDQQPFILDGEMVAFDPSTNQILPFQEISKRINLLDTRRVFPVKFFGFECLFYGVELFDYSLRYRREVFKKQFPFLDLIQAFPSESKSQCDQYLSNNPSVEGLVFKDHSKKYHFTRSKSFWIKYKKDLYGSSFDSIDLAVIGGNYGNFSQKSIIRSFVLAARSSDNFLYDICSIGSGFSEEELIYYTNYFQKNSVVSSNYFFRTSPNLIINPPLIFEVKFDSISLDQSGKLSLRFPIFVRERSDKSINEITSISMLFNIYSLNKKRGK